MDFVGLVEFSLQCFSVLAWPLLALVYPLCCSIRAIEANSISASQKLNTYWVVFSLILLFEHAFSKLLEWLPLWPYIRLMIVFSLVTPHFNGAFYVYKHLICPCLSIDLQIAINWFNKQTKFSFKRDNFLAEVERYVKENGPEALEKIVASSSERTKSGPDLKDLKAVSSTENKEFKSRRPNDVQKDIKAVQVGQPEPNLTGTENGRFSSMDVKKEAIGLASDRGTQKTPPSKKVQEWTCAISQVTTQSDTTFNSHLDGKNHKAVYETREMQSQAELKLTQIENSTFVAVETNEKAVEDTPVREVLEAPKRVQKEWTCALCQLTTQSEATLNSHLQGRKHKAACEALKAKNQTSAPKTAPSSTAKESHQPNEDPRKSTMSSASKKSDKSKEEPAEGAARNETKGNTISTSKEKVKSEQQNPNEAPGIKENGPEALEKNVASSSERTKSSPDLKEFRSVSSVENKEVISGKPNVLQKDIKAVQVSQPEPNFPGTENSRFSSTDIEKEAIGFASDRGTLKTPRSKKFQEWTSGIRKTESATLYNNHLDGKNYKAWEMKSQAELKLTQIENSTFVALETEEKAVGVPTGREVHEDSQEVQKEWTCALCQLTTQSEATLNSHLQGRKHKARCEALKAKNQTSAPKTAPSSTAKESHQLNDEDPRKSTMSSASKKSDKSKVEPAEGAAGNGTKSNIVSTSMEKVKSEQQNPNGIKDLTLSCSICNVHCPSEIVMASHLNGMKHKKKIQQLLQNLL